MMEDEIQKIYNEYSEIVQDIIKAKDKMILDAFMKLGFDFDYLVSHRNEFKIIVSKYGIPEYIESYMWNGVELFSYYMRYNDEGVVYGIGRLLDSECV